MGRKPGQQSNKAPVLAYLQEHVGEPEHLMTLACLIWNTEAERYTRALINTTLA